MMMLLLMMIMMMKMKKKRGRREEEKLIEVIDRCIMFPQTNVIEHLKTLSIAV